MACPESLLVLDLGAARAHMRGMTKPFWKTKTLEEMSAAEFLEFHAVFKPLILPINDILSEIGLEAARSKQIRNFSSGMKQRVKLAQAIFSDASLLLLDEPCTNLDAAGYELYHRLISTYCGSRTVIVSSNDPNEYSFCDQRINIMDYKSLSAPR